MLECFTNVISKYINRDLTLYQFQTNIARRTADPEIDSVTQVIFIQSSSKDAYLAT